MISKEVTNSAVLNLIEEIRAEIPDLLIKYNKPWWLRVVFGLPGIRNFHWENYTQTVGSTLYLSERWNSYSNVGKCITLRHEQAHLRQFKKYGFVLFLFLYFLVFFPIGLAYFRATFEREGLKAGLEERVKHFGTGEEIRESLRGSYNRVFCSSSYLWAWPFKKVINKWFEEDWASIAQE